MGQKTNSNTLENNNVIRLVWSFLSFEYLHYSYSTGQLCWNKSDFQMYVKHTFRFNCHEYYIVPSWWAAISNLEIHLQLIWRLLTRSTWFESSYAITIALILQCLCQKVSTQVIIQDRLTQFLKTIQPEMIATLQSFTYHIYATSDNTNLWQYSMYSNMYHVWSEFG